MELHEIREKLKEMYGGENKPITDGHYDQSLAVLHSPAHCRQKTILIEP